MKKLFFGGVHPHDQKGMSTGKPSLKAVLPEQVVIPLQQHIGAPCRPLVAVGDSVKRGQKIGDGEGLCVPVHASVSGVVKAIEVRPHPTAGSAMAIVIENDFQDTAVTNPIPETEEEILHAIREAGIVGMGGAAFPGNAKALSAMGKVDTLIANGCECEPYITSDDSLLRTNPEQVLEGMRILGELLKPQKIVLAIEDNKAEAIERLRSFAGSYPDIEIRVLPTRYPQGAEKQLVQSVTGREVPSGQLPSAVGCAVFNVSTYAAVYQAVKLGIPVTQRIVTVSGEGVKAPQNFIVRIGTSFADLIAEAGGLNDNVDRVISGGPMMGRAQSDVDVPVVKATNSILCLPKKAKLQQTACLRCGKCLSVCPMRLQPLYIYRAVKAEDIQAVERTHVMDCMECGCCTYNCPAGLPLTEYCHNGKILLKEAKKA